MRPRLKVCCIASVDEARLAIAHGADALGLVAAMPSGPGVIDETQIAVIAAATPPPIATFLLTSETTAAAIAAQWERCRTTTIQLTDHVPIDDHRALRQALPGVKRVQVIHVQDQRSYDEALELAPWVDALLLDSGAPNAAVKELGGTGRTHDWSISAAICAGAPVPVFLAGGLRANNIGEALRAVRPFGVDLCSGVRTDGALNAEKLSAFVAALSTNS